MMTPVQRYLRGRWTLFDTWLRSQAHRSDMVGELAKEINGAGGNDWPVMRWVDRNMSANSHQEAQFVQATREFNVAHPLQLPDENATALAARRSMAGKPPRFRSRNVRSVGPKMRAYVMARDNFRCRRCGASSCDEGVRLVIDHIVPVAKGGGNEHTNLQILCGDCNAGKSADAPHSHDLRAP